MDSPKLSPSTKIYVARARGLVGSAIWRNLEQRGYTNLVGRTHSELDLTDPRRCACVLRMRSALRR